MAGMEQIQANMDSIQIVASPSHLPASPPTTSHVKRIILEFEDQRFLPLPAPPNFRHCGLFDGQNHVLSVRSRMVPGQDGGEPDSDEEHEEEDGDRKEMAKSMHSLVFECNWWLEGENEKLKNKKPSFKKRVKKFFQSLMCTSAKSR